MIGHVIRSRRTRFLVSCVAAFALASVLGCGDDDNPMEAEAFVGLRGTPKELLESWFERAYTTKDSVRYEEMLAPEFRFTFQEADAESLQSDGTLPPGTSFWGITSDLRSTGAMFRSCNVGDIALDILASTDQPADSLDACESCRRVEATITLRVTTNPQSTDPLIFAVDSPQTFFVRKDAADTTQWVLVRHIDIPRSFRKLGGSEAATPDAKADTEPTSWGNVKGLYR